MKKKNFIYQMLCLVLLLGSGTRVCAQNGSEYAPSITQGYSFNPQNQGFASPQTAEFVKYGNIKMNYYNGLLDLEVPLVEYKDPAFELNTSIKYISDGFKPGRRPSVVGNNWVLNVGGAITRNVVGAADDVRNRRDPKQGIHTSDGLLVGIRDGLFKAYSKTDLFNLNFELVTYSGLYKEPAHDLAPDIFEFNFGHHHGKFIIDNSGKARCISGGGYKINLDQMAVQDFTLDGTPISSIITIDTPDGYLYTFGGETSKLEYSIPNNPRELKKKPVQITSWYLSSIKDVTRQRTVYYAYQSHVLKNKYHFFLSTLEEGWNEDASSPIIHFARKNHLLLEDKVYTPILNSITIDETVIDFTIKTHPVNFWGDSEDSNLLYLSDVTMKNNSKIIKSYHMDYEVKGKYFFLKKLTGNNLSENPAIYKFDYDLGFTLPDPLTTSTDHWGYWNGRYDLIDNVDTFFDSSFPARKNVNTSFCSCTLLNRVTYPTGGEEEIEYEHNRYRIYNKKSISGFGWYLNFELDDTPFGGSRVKELSLYNPDTKRKMKRIFSYKDEFGDESGIINELPKYKIPDENITGFKLGINGMHVYHSITVSSMSSNSIGRLNNISEFPIGYVYVTETFDDGSNDRYHFSSFLDHPDNGELNVKTFIDPTIIKRDFTSFQVVDKALNYTANDNSAFRGKILTKKSCNNKGKIVAMEEYTYNSGSSASNYEVSITFNAGCFLANKILTTPCLLTKEKLTDENGVTVIHNYEYNSDGFVTQKETVNSNGEHVYLQYVHPGETSIIPYDGYYSNLVRYNRIEEPVAIIKYIKKPGENVRKVVDFIYTHYSSTTNAGLQKRSLTKGYFKGTLPEDKNIDDYPVLERPVEFIEAYDNYDQYGNIVTLRTNELTTIYLWSQRGKYLIAEIKGSSYDEVKATLKKSPELISFDSYFSMQELEKLREKLPHAQVTIYHHQPQTGVKYHATPDGKATYFQYDDQGRLKQKLQKGEKGKLQLIEYNKYHYSNK